jgi:hypothetical protein
MSKHIKQRKSTQRAKFAIGLLYAGESVEEAARKSHLSRERIERLAWAVGRSKHLTEGDTQMTEAQDHNTELGTTGVPYRSEQAEELIAERMKQLSASGRPAERMDVIAELANEGKIQTGYNPLVGAEQALRDALPDKYRQEGAPSQWAGRTLAESMAIATAAKIGTRQNNAPQPSTERVIELSEESEREERIEAITSQGYTRAHAEHILEFNEREGRG